MKFERLAITFLFLLGWSQWALAQVDLVESNLPILIIDTNLEEIPDEPKIEATLKISYQGEGEMNSINGPFESYDGFIGIEIRGASSQWAFPKKGYGVETRFSDGSNNNVSLLGLPKENDWVLHGPYSDKALIRNALAYTLAGEIMDYAPRIVFCEMVLNGSYQGIYLLTEKIKRDNDRVDVKENISNELDGGFIIKMDKEAGGSNLGWFSNVSPTTDPDYFQYYQYHYPKAEDISDNQRSVVRSYMDDFEERMRSSTFRDSLSGYPTLINELSFIDFILISEVSKNVDAYRLSTYLHKNSTADEDELKAGPIWDFNLSFGNADYCTGGHPEGWVISKFNQLCPDDSYQIPFWWNRLLSDENFNKLGRERWNELKSLSFSEAHIHHLIDSLSLLLAPAQERNFLQWPVLNEYVWPNNYVGGSYDAEILHIKNWVATRLKWIDNQHTDLFPFFPSSPNGSLYHIYPSPVTEWLTIEYYLSKVESLNIRIYTSSGKLVQYYDFSQNNPAYNTQFLDVSDLAAGIYFIQFIRDSEATQLKKFTKF